MNFDDFMRIAQVGIETAIFVSGPVLLLGLVAGLIVSIFQASTQISDGALAFIPKIGATVVGLLLFGNFMMNRLVFFTTWAYQQIGELTP